MHRFRPFIEHAQGCGGSDSDKYRRCRKAVISRGIRAGCAKSDSWPQTLCHPGPDPGSRFDAVANIGTPDQVRGDGADLPLYALIINAAIQRAAPNNTAARRDDIAVVPGEAGGADHCALLGAGQGGGDARGLDLG